MSTAAKERPIVLKSWEVKAILEGRKTMTRRVVKPVRGYTQYNVCRPDLAAAPHEVWWHCEYQSVGVMQACPYGQPGDQLWLREAWRVPASLNDLSGKQIAKKCLEAGYRKPWCPIQYESDGSRNREKDWREFAEPGRYRHARFMPRWASRITLEVTGVCVERLQDITEQSAWSEGIQDFMGGPTPWAGVCAPCSVHGFASAWASINGADNWHANPWVWVIEFKKVTTP